MKNYILVTLVLSNFLRETGFEVFHIHLGANNGSILLV